MLYILTDSQKLIILTLHTYKNIIQKNKKDADSQPQSQQWPHNSRIVIQNSHPHPTPTQAAQTNNKLIPTDVIIIIYGIEN